MYLTNKDLLDNTGNSAQCQVTLTENWCLAESLHCSPETVTTLLIGSKFSSVQSLSVRDSLQPHGLQDPRFPYPSPTPRVCSNSCPSSWWVYPTISSSVVPFSCLPSFPASGSFPVSQFFTSRGQSIGASASTSVGYTPIFLIGYSPIQNKKKKNIVYLYKRIDIWRSGERTSIS